MVNPNQPISDAPSFTDSDKATKHGNFPTPLSDAPSFSESISFLGPPITVDATFAHLNGRDFFIQGVDSTPNRERGAICTISMGSTVYSTGGVPVDFTQSLIKFRTVYLCKVIGGTKLYSLYVPDANNDADEGELKFFDSAGAELPQGSTLLQNLNVQCYIRGN